ncbi:MAG: transglutaminase-like domain-containing protein [Planctomycetota bacterium]
MNPSEPTPLHCRPEAFETLADELDALDTTRGLVRCAVAVSMHELDTTGPDEVEARLDALAASIAQRLSSDQPRAVLAHAHAVLFDEAGFTGDTEDYYHPRNSYLACILDKKQGLPITLALIYKAVLETLGLETRGINAPGHFLAAVRDHPDKPRVLIDPFHGGKLLTREEAFTRIETIAGGSVIRDDALLRPASHVEWLVRIIQNLVAAFDRLGRRDDMAAMTEMRTLVESVR